MGIQTLVAMGGADLWSSPDAANWTQHLTPFSTVEGAEIKAMANSTSETVVVGGVGRYIDGWGWTMYTDQAKVTVGNLALEGWSDLATLPIPGFACTVAYAPELKRYVVGADMDYGPSESVINPLRVAISDDGGATWSSVVLPTKIHRVSQIIWADAFGLFILVGWVNTGYLGEGGFGILTSPDGATWSTPTIVLASDGSIIEEVLGEAWGMSFRGAGWAPEIGRAVAYGGIPYLSSSDGSIWYLWELEGGNIPPHVDYGAWSPDLGYFLFAGDIAAISS